MLVPALCREHVTPEMFFTTHALPSLTSAEGCPPLFGSSQVSGRRRRACALASVRRPNRACSFPAHGFHEDSTSRGRKRRN